MIEFKSYESKPIVRDAYCIKREDTIEQKEGGTECRVVDEDGASVTFVAYEEVWAGDYIVYLTAEATYHCNAAVFHDRNIVVK
jgi:hypothetical protein